MHASISLETGCGEPWSSDSRIQSLLTSLPTPTAVVSRSVKEYLGLPNPSHGLWPSQIRRTDLSVTIPFRLKDPDLPPNMVP